MWASLFMTNKRQEINITALFMQKLFILSLGFTKGYFNTQPCCGYEKIYYYSIN